VLPVIVIVIVIVIVAVVAGGGARQKVGPDQAGTVDAHKNVDLFYHLYRFGHSQVPELDAVRGIMMGS